jgi:hypothetical protein
MLRSFFVPIHSATSLNESKNIYMPATLIFLKKTIFLYSLHSYKIVLTELYHTNVTPEVRVTNIYYYQASISGKAGVLVNVK